MGETKLDATHLDRRRLLATAAAGAFTMAVGRTALAQSAPPAVPLPPSWNTELKQLAPNVYAFIRGGGAGGDNGSLSNAGLIVGPDNAMIVDTLGPPIHAKEFRDIVLRTTSKPVTRVVLTHHHRDHANGAYLWEPAEIVGTRMARELVIAEGIPPHPYDNHPEWQKGMSELRLAPPTTVITSDVTYYYGDQQVEVLVTGPAHTAGDCMVYLPKEKILFAGDIAFFDCTPSPGSSTFSGWLATIDRIMKMDVDVIVPGHGPLGGKKELADMTAFVKLLINGIRRGYNAGLRPAQAAANADLGKYATWGNSERIATTAFRLYTEWNGTSSLDQDFAAQAKVQAEFFQLRPDLAKFRGR